MARKKYQLKHLTQLATKVKVGDKYVKVVFNNSTNGADKTPGIFSTSDVEIQKALEARPDFKQKFEIVVVEEVKEEPTSASGTNEEIIYADVITVQAARDILVANHECTQSSLPNKVAIVAKASELKVKFPNLPE